MQGSRTHTSANPSPVVMMEPLLESTATSCTPEYVCEVANTALRWNEHYKNVINRHCVEMKLKLTLRCGRLHRASEPSV